MCMTNKPNHLQRNINSLYSFVSVVVVFIYVTAFRKFTVHFPHKI